MKMTHKHDVYFSPHSTETHSLVMQIADYCNKRGIWYKISESTLGIGIVYGGNVGYVIDADRKTENRSEKPNNCEKDCFLCKWLGDVDVCGRCRNRNLFAEADTEPTRSKMEQVDKDINVRSKDEPQTEDADCDKCIWSVCNYNKAFAFEDEPQTDTEIAKAIVHKMIDDAVIAEDAYPDLRQKMHDAVDEYEPQTDCAWK